MRAHFFELFLSCPFLLAFAARNRDPQPSLEDQHFVANTYGFLRTSSDQVGQAAQSTLGIQGSLTQLSDELSGEYDTWTAKKSSLVADNDRVRVAIAHSQGALQEHAIMREQALRLQDEIANRKTEREQFAVITAKARQAWNLEKEGEERVQARLEDELDQARLSKKQKEIEAQAKRASITEENRKIQKQIFEVNAQILKAQTDASNNRLAAGEKHSALQTASDSIQDHMHNLQTKVVAQAQLQQEIRTYEKRVASQIEERVKLMQSMLKTQKNCQAKLAGFETEVRTAQDDTRKAKKAMAKCQLQDAQNQEAQGVLNQCLVARKGGR